MFDSEIDVYEHEGEEHVDQCECDGNSDSSP